MYIVELSDGFAPRRTDTRWFILVKTLKAIQDSAGGGISDNDPGCNDTRRILLQKILCALDGVPYNG